MELKELYKYVYKCNKCKNTYGSDYKDESMICPVCTKKLMKNTHKNNGKKKK